MHNFALICSDIHLKTNLLSYNNGLYKAKQLERILEECKTGDYKYLFILGDTFHDKDIVSATLLQVFRDFLNDVTSIGLEVIVIVGNHDFASDSYQYHSLQPFIGIKNVTIVDKEYILNNLLFIGFRRKRSEFLEIIKDKQDIDVLFGHQDLKGFDCGDDYIELNEYIEHDDLKKFKLVMFGHYHKPQELILVNNSYNTTINFVGSVISTDHKDENVDKRFIKLNLETLEFVSIDTNLNFHKTILLDLNENPNASLPEIPQNLLELGYKFKVKIRGTKEQISVLDKPTNYQAKIVKEIISSTRKNIKLNSMESNDEILKRYIIDELKNYNDQHLDPTKTEKYLRKYIMAVKK